MLVQANCQVRWQFFIPVKRRFFPYIFLTKIVGWSPCDQPLETEASIVFITADWTAEAVVPAGKRENGGADKKKIGSSNPGVILGKEIGGEWI